MERKMNIAKPAVRWLFLDLNAFFASCACAPTQRGPDRCTALPIVEKMATCPLNVNNGIAI